MTVKQTPFSYDIAYNPYQEIWVVFRVDYINYNLRSIYKASSKKECQEWLKEHKRLKGLIK